jgi:hypothetical protein
MSGVTEFMIPILYLSYFIEPDTVVFEKYVSVLNIYHFFLLLLGVNIFQDMTLASHYNFIEF